jgi:hypothetical protein
MTARSSAPSTPAAEARTSVYRTREDFLAALGTAKGLVSGNPAYGSAVRVLVHLSWKSPAGTVAWHKGTNADMVANAATMGAKPGVKIPEALKGVLAALDKAADTDARKAAVAAIRKAA